MNISSNRYKRHVTFFSETHQLKINDTTCQNFESDYVTENSFMFNMNKLPAPYKEFITESPLDSEFSIDTSRINENTCNLIENKLIILIRNPDTCDTITKLIFCLLEYMATIKQPSINMILPQHNNEKIILLSKQFYNKLIRQCNMAQIDTPNLLELQGFIGIYGDNVMEDNGVNVYITKLVTKCYAYHNWCYHDVAISETFKNFIITLPKSIISMCCDKQTAQTLGITHIYIDTLAINIQEFSGGSYTNGLIVSDNNNNNKNTHVYIKKSDKSRHTELMKSFCNANYTSFRKIIEDILCQNIGHNLKVNLLSAQDILKIPALFYALQLTKKPINIEIYFELIMNSDLFAYQKLDLLFARESDSNLPALSQALAHGQYATNIRIFIQLILCSELYDEQKLALLHSRDINDMTAILYALTNGEKSDNIRLFVDMVLHSELVLVHKLELLDNKILSCALKTSETPLTNIEQFVLGILNSQYLSSPDKYQLLQLNNKENVSRDKIKLMHNLIKNCNHINVSDKSNLLLIFNR